MIWTQPQIDELLALYRQGLTSYQMAAHFKVTRSAICGRIHRERVRLGEIEVKPRIRNRKPQRRKQMLTLPSSAVEFGVSAYIRNTPDRPCEGRLASIVDVTGCRWPVRDDESYVGGVAFCNHATDGKTYCPYHHQESIASYSKALIKKTISNTLYTLTKREAA